MTRRTASESLGPNFYRLWVASAISNLGDGVRWTALPLLAAQITREPALVAAVDLAAGLPWALFALVSGAVVDRIDRRKAMVTANVCRAVFMAVLAALVATGAESLAVLYAVAFLLGSAETVFDNAAQAIMPALVHRDQLERANGRLFAAEISANQFIGPPLGAFLFVAVAAAPFLLDAASFAIAAGLIATLSGSFRISSGRATTSIRTDIAEGLKWLWNHRLIRTLAISLGVMNAANTAAFSIFVLFALQILDVSEVGFGILSTCLAIGSVIGSLFASRLGRLAPGPTLISQIVLNGSAYLVIGLTSNPFVVGAMSILTGITMTVWNVITVSMRQRIIPDRLLGRVNSVYRLMGWGTMPVGAVLGGALASAFGLRVPWFFAFGAYALLAVAVLPVVNTKAIVAARAEAERRDRGAEPPA